MTIFRGSYLQAAALWRAGEFGPPSPTVTWQQYETMPADPIAATDGAEDELRERGLINDHGPTDELRELLTVFARAQMEADLKYVPEPGREARVLVALQGRSAARWWIDQGEVVIESVHSSSAYGALIGTLPEVPPVSGKPVSLRTDHLREAAGASSSQSAVEAERAAITALRRAGVRSDDARNAVRMLSGGRRLQGQFGVAAYTPRMRKRIRGSRIVEVVDTDDGRAIRYQVGDHTTIAPGKPDLTVRAVSQLVDEARADARDA